MQHLIAFHCRPSDLDSLCGYGPIGGEQHLVSALKRKLTQYNGLDLTNQEVVVTAGANQVGGCGDRDGYGDGGGGGEG